MLSNATGNSNPNVVYTSNPVSINNRPNYGTESINSILMNPTSPCITDNSQSKNG